MHGTGCLGRIRGSGVRFDVMLYFAYDGSIHGDWIAHYAVRLASHDAGRALRVIYVDEGRWTTADLDEKFARLQRIAGRLSVSLQTDIVRGKRDVFSSLVEQAADDNGSILFCGARAASQARGLLAGSVSQRLLREPRLRVLALRVVQPGLLGAPRNLLLPVSGHPRGISLAMPFLKLFAPDVARLHLLLVKHVGRYWFRQLSFEKAERLRRAGWEYCEQVEQELIQGLALHKSQLDATVIVSDDPPKEIVIHANRTRSRLIFMGASERSLAKRLWYGNPIEQVLRSSGCDVAVYRGIP